MNFLFHDKEILRRCNEIWDKVKNLFKKEFNRQPIYNDNYIKAKISLYNVNFYSNKVHEENKRLPVYLQYYQILLVMQKKKFHKYSQKNANMKQKIKT